MPSIWGLSRVNASGNGAQEGSAWQALSTTALSLAHDIHGDSPVGRLEVKEAAASELVLQTNHQWKLIEDYPKNDNTTNDNVWFVIGYILNPRPAAILHDAQLGEQKHQMGFSCE